MPPQLRISLIRRELADTRQPREVARRSGRPTKARKLGLVLLANLMMFSLTGLLAEVGFRLFWHPRCWAHAENWLLGSGEDRAGRKWWPNSAYRMESNEFLVRFRSNAQGYRARPDPSLTATPYRIAFVGDSFTEAKQVDYDQTFVALLERELTTWPCDDAPACENYGVSGTGIFDYWHRITHDVFRAGSAPPAVVLCIYPGNDFTDYCPDDGFEPDGTPKREYFEQPTWAKHFVTWLVLKSKFASYVDLELRLRGIGNKPRQLDAPPLWWTDPTLAVAAQNSPGIRRVRALLHAIERECDRHATRLVILIVGPAVNYAAKDGRSPLTQIFSAWGIRAPVIDVAAMASATPKPSRLVFGYDGHLNPAGHRYLADAALGPLGQALGLGPPLQDRVATTAPSFSSNAPSANSP
jgi:hypothetical protein